MRWILKDTSTNRTKASVTLSKPSGQSGLKSRLALAWHAFNGLVARNGIELAGYIAFTTLLSLFPFIIFLESIAGYFGDTRTGQDFIATLSLFAPPEVMKTLEPVIEEVTHTPSKSLLTVGMVLALYSAASGVSGVRLALNLAYGVEENRPFWFRKAQDFIIVLFGSVVLILTSAAVIFGPWLLNVLSWFTFIDPADQGLWHMARYGFTLVILTASTIALHRILPDSRLTVRQILPGALLTTILWIVAASVLTVYFDKFANYALTYGSLGGVIVTLMFFYVSAIIFIFGGEINAALLGRSEEQPPPPTQELGLSPEKS
jgi:membrane protein